MEYQVVLANGRATSLSAFRVRFDFGGRHLQLCSMKTLSGLPCLTVMTEGMGDRGIHVSGCGNTATLWWKPWRRRSVSEGPRAREPSTLVQPDAQGDFLPYPEGIHELRDVAAGIRLDLAWLSRFGTSEARCLENERADADLTPYLQVFFGAANVVSLHGRQTFSRAAARQDYLAWAAEHHLPTRGSP